MKDKTLYWILGIIAAYFVIRFLAGKIADKSNGVQKNVLIKKNILTEHLEGEEGPTCKYCGSKTYYKKQLSPLGPGRGYVLRAVCSNPDCKSHMLLY